MSIDPIANVSMRHAFSGPTMGTRWSAILFTQPHLSTDAIKSALQAEVDLVDHQMSTWKPLSNLMVLNRTPVGEWLSVPPELFSVVALGLEIARDSAGSFDIAVGEAIAAWGFGTAGSELDKSRIDALSRNSRTAEAVEIDPQSSRLRRLVDVQIDLSAIAKGYGVDRLGKALHSLGITDYLVGIDGELLASGSRPDGAGWVIGLERPLRGWRDLAHKITVSDMAIATSGDYRHWREDAGSIISHIIDPHTLRPLNNGVASVTVTARTCAIADAWATALMVLGPHTGPAKARELGLDALFTIHRNGGFVEIGVGGLANLVKTPPTGGHL